LATGFAIAGGFAGIGISPLIIASKSFIAAPSMLSYAR